MTTLTPRFQCYRRLRLSGRSPQEALAFLPLLVGRTLFIAPGPDGWTLFRGAEPLCSAFDLTTLVSVMVKVDKEVQDV